MNILNNITLESNKQIRFNFEGGDLSSDAGLLLIKEFAHKIGFNKIIKQQFKTNDSALFRHHTDSDNLLQMLFQIYGAYFTDDCADELTNDPVMTAILDKPNLASQPTISRFFNRMDENTLKQFDAINKQLRKVVYSMDKPEMILFDIDSTLLNTYGNQEDEAFNYHYQAHGYHPLVCYDGLTGDLLKINIRNGKDYSSTGVEDFMQPLFDEFLNDYPDVKLFLRGDSGFATPGLYEQCETNGTSYVIRLKNNSTLKKLSEHLDDELNDLTKDNAIDYAVVYGEFTYQATTWKQPRRVVCKVEKPDGQMVHMHTFIVTNMDLNPEQAITLYCNRGRMENYIKEGKSGFDFAAVSSSTKVVNANRVQLHALAYNLFNLFRRLVLPESMSSQLIDTIRLKVLKVAAKIVHSARYIYFKLSSSCPYKDIFYQTITNISKLTPKLE